MPSRGNRKSKIPLADIDAFFRSAVAAVPDRHRFKAKLTAESVKPLRQLDTANPDLIVNDNFRLGLAVFKYRDGPVDDRYASPLLPSQAVATVQNSLPFGLLTCSTQR